MCDVMKLSKPQMLIYTMDKSVGGAVSVLCGSILFGKSLDCGMLADLLNTIVKNNPSLRTIIRETNDIEQFYEAYQPLYYETREFLNIEELDRFASEYAKIKLDLSGRLFEFIIISLPDHTGVLIKMHHIISDAWSLSLLCKQLCLLLEGNEPQYGDYSHYIENENKYIHSARYQRDKSFFLNEYHKLDEVIHLHDSSSKTYLANRREMMIEAEDTAIIQDYCQIHSVSPFMLFTTAVSIYFSRVCNHADKFYLGVAILNRSTTEELNTVGMFVNTVPFLQQLDSSSDFDTTLKHTRDNLLLTIRHQKFNTGEVLKSIREESEFKGKLYDIMISYQNAKVSDSEHCIRTKWYHSGIQEESLQIHINDRDNEGIYRIQYDYLMERFSEKQIERIHGYLMNILFDGMNRGNASIANLKMLSDEETNTLMYLFQGKTAFYPKDKCVHELFEEHVRMHPSRAAVIAVDQTLSYDALNRLANRVAHALRQRGVKTGDLVGINLPRRSYYFAAAIGVLKAGAAYIPIVPDYPEERVHYIMQDSKASFLIDDTAISLLLSETCEDNLNIQISSEEKCYCRYTSGSTGNPKGVLVSHQNVMNVIFEMDRLEHVDVILGITPVGFDMCVTENLYSVMTGKTLVFVDETSILDSCRLAQLVTKHNVDMITTTPSKMRLYTKDQAFKRVLGRLRVLSFGGEALSVEFMRCMRSFTDAVLSNEYGPTETTCYSTSYIIRGDVEEVSIGKPIANTQVYIVDKFLNLVPIGAKGELCIAGDGVGLGYLNKPELTSERFVKNPFGCGKLYKTGDFAYWNGDGNIIYIGRDDFQVKLHGLRIELGEIESALKDIDGIEDAVVIIRENHLAQQVLCAFYTGFVFEVHELKEKLGRVLPRYMIPGMIIHVASIPMTAHGKLDKRALPDVDFEQYSQSACYIAPQTDLEIKLCNLLSEIIKVERIGVETDFFDLGLDSLRAIEFTVKAKCDNIDIPLQMVYEHPSVRALAQFLMGKASSIDEYPHEAFEKYRNILNRNVFTHVEDSCQRRLGTVVLTGATGFLGSQILDQLLKAGADRVFCVVRNEDKLKKTLSYYFDDQYMREMGNKIIPVIADIETDNLHLPYQSRVDTVIHAAASVKHFGKYQSFDRTNVGGTRRVLDIARRYDARFIHISTMSVCGHALDNSLDHLHDSVQQFDERCFFIGQSLDNVYIRSKFEAERVVLDAICDGIDAKIIRVGNLTNRYCDLLFQPNYMENAFLNRFRALIALGKLPDYFCHHSVEFSPVDFTALGVVKLAEYASHNQIIFHLYHPKGVQFDQFLSLFHQVGISMEIVDSSAFMDVLKTMLHVSGKSWIYEAFQNDIDEHGKLQFESNIVLNNDLTTGFLKSIGFEWKDINFDYLSKYICYFRKLGYFV